VHDQPENQVVQFLRSPGVKRRERQDNKIHYFLDRATKEQTAHQRMFLQKNQPDAGSVVNRRGREGDKKMQEDTKNIRACAPLESLPPQQAGGNR